MDISAKLQAKIIIPSIPSMLLGHLGVRGGGSRKVRNTVKLMERESSKGRSILIHAMSNNGFFFLSACMLRSTTNLEGSVTGLVLDSCPCREISTPPNPKLDILYSS